MDVSLSGEMGMLHEPKNHGLEFSSNILFPQSKLPQLILIRHEYDELIHKPQGVGYGTESQIQFAWSSTTYCPTRQ